MIALWTGIVLGVAGSSHCAGMCGPLVLVANPLLGGRSPGPGSGPGPRPAADGGAPAPAGDGRLHRTRHVLLYNAGRIGTYMVLGAVAGISGTLLTSAGLGRWLAIAAGALLVVSAVRGSGLFGGLFGGGAGHGPVARLVSGALGRAGVWMRAHHVQGPLLFGALNGLLPCGLVYAAVAAAAGFGNLPDALLFMTGFGAGTVPMLAAIALSGTRLAAMLPARVRRIAPVALALAGLLLVARGVSPPHRHGSVPPSTVQDAPASAPVPSPPHLH